MSAKAFLKSRLGPGLCTALSQVRVELKVLAQHRSSTRNAKRLLSSIPVKLNCGCGPFAKIGWINIDTARSADLHLDLRRKLPFPDGCASFVYSEHFFEHLEYPQETGTFLSESIRVLAPGGQFRVGVPDTEWPLNAYVKQDDAYFSGVRERWHPSYCNTRMHNINYHFRQGTQHKYAYDYETLAAVLREAGFSRVEKSDYEPTIDTEHRRIGTLYVNAFK